MPDAPTPVAMRLEKALFDHGYRVSYSRTGNRVSPSSVAKVLDNAGVREVVEALEWMISCKRPTHYLIAQEAKSALSALTGESKERSDVDV